MSGGEYVHGKCPTLIKRAVTASTSPVRWSVVVAVQSPTKSSEDFSSGQAAGGRGPDRAAVVASRARNRVHRPTHRLARIIASGKLAIAPTDAATAAAAAAAASESVHSTPTRFVVARSRSLRPARRPRCAEHINLRSLHATPPARPLSERNRPTDDESNEFSFPRMTRDVTRLHVVLSSRPCCWCCGDGGRVRSDKRMTK